jgi:hypothetical protein
LVSKKLPQEQIFNKTFDTHFLPTGRDFLPKIGIFRQTRYLIAYQYIIYKILAFRVSSQVGDNFHQV